MPSLAILLAWQFVFDDFCQLASHPCSSSLWPSELGVQAQLVNGSFSHIRARTATCQWEFYKLSYMLKVHQVAYLSILFPLHWPFSIGYSWSVYLKFPPVRLSKDGTGWQCCAWPQALSRRLWRFCQWSGILHRLSPFVVFQSKGISLHKTSSLHAWRQQLCMVGLQPILTRSQWW